MNDDVDQNGARRTQITFKGSFYLDKRIDNSYGFLSYIQNGLKIFEKGIYNSKMYLSAIG